MKTSYNEQQKTRILVLGDLVDNPLSAVDRSAVLHALKEANDSIEDVLPLLARETQEKVRSLAERGFQLSLEIEKLSQRGVYVAFPNTPFFERAERFFTCEVGLLFATGPWELLQNDDLAVSLSFSECQQNDYRGVLVADIPFNTLLRNEHIRSSLGQSRLLLISNLYRSAANAVANTTNRQTRRPLSTSFGSKCVFVSGSRSQTEIPAIVQESLNAIVAKELSVLIGDSNKGVDNEVLDYLRAPLYPNVAVYTVNKRTRVRVEPDWETRVIEADPRQKPQERQMVKDRAMAEAADWGLAVFNPLEKTRFGSVRVSAGTLRNAIHLLLRSKAVKFFYVYEGQMRAKNLRSLRDLDEVIASYRQERVPKKELDLILASRKVVSDNDATLEKFRKINMKYLSLLKAEKSRIADLTREGTELNEVLNQPRLPLFA